MNPTHGIQMDDDELDELYRRDQYRHWQFIELPERSMPAPDRFKRALLLYGVLSGLLLGALVKWGPVVWRMVR